MTTLQTRIDAVGAYESYLNGNLTDWNIYCKSLDKRQVYEVIECLKYQNNLSLAKVMDLLEMLTRK